MNQSSHTQFYDRSGAALNLALYMFPACPFCQRVLAQAQQLNMSLPMYDIHQDPEARERLRSVGGRTTVPCLFINGKPLYESEDIMRYLREQVVAKPAS